MPSPSFFFIVQLLTASCQGPENSDPSSLNHKSQGLQTRFISLRRRSRYEVSLTAELFILSEQCTYYLGSQPSRFSVQQDHRVLDDYN
jgi:hypothetical protein